MENFLPRLELPPEVRRTFRFHLAYALLDAACGGILLNAPFVALRTIHAQNWQLPLRDGCVGVGMLASLYLGSWMAPRRKMPFVFIPGVLAAVSLLGMAAALVLGNAFWFLLCLGIGGIFEIVTRPAIAAILRQNYPVVHRGRLTAVVRQWSSLSFLISLMLLAYILRESGDRAQIVAAVAIVAAGVLGLIGFLCFRQIHVADDPAHIRPDYRMEIFKNLRDSVAVIVRDARYRRYLLGCFLEGFFMMLYLPQVPALLSTTLKFDYWWCAAFSHGIPTFTAFLATGLLGRWFDRANPWVSWALVRFAFGVDALLLAATPLGAAMLPALVFVLPLLGRTLRGGVQGGWWILWWQIGITHFAPPGEDTSRYAGIMVFLNGAIKIAAAVVGMALTSPLLSIRPVTLLWIGGLGVIVSGFYSLWQAARERREHLPQTFTEFESQFGRVSSK